MEPSVTLNTKRSFLPEYDRLKKFTIPKRIPDKDFLTDCSTNQRDCQEVKERLNQGCFDRECDLGSLWHFDKIEMVHNKDLEEEFVAKRTKMREQGRGDKELSSFLVVSKDEVLKICQSGLRTSNSIKKEPDIMRELGNPQLGVYLFRHVDIALNYASKHSVQVENIIIFRVLLGKVKKIQPPKGKKKVVLDPTPNYDCHVSRVNPSLKDSVEDQAIGSLVYFYEYSELSKPVSRPRQCLPHAVVKVKCINQKVRANYPVVSLKTRPKKFSKGRGRDLLLENCTIVTRIGNSKLIYEHFHKPKNSAASDNLSADVSSLSESAPNWNGSGAETQSSKIKCILPGQWNSAQVEADVQNFECIPDVDCNREAKSDHMGTYSKNSNDISVNCGELSTIITSKWIKDPRLTKRGKNPEEQNGEPVSHGILQCENKLKYQTEKLSATLGIPWPGPEELFLRNDSWHMVSEVQNMAKRLWKDREILDSQNTGADLDLSHHSLKSADCGIKTANQIFAGRDERIEYSKPLLGQNENSVCTDSVDSTYISNGTYAHSKEQPVLLPPFQISTCIHNPEGVTADQDELSGGKEMYSQFQEDDGYSSEAQCSASLDSKCSKNHCTSKEDGGTLHSRFHRRMHSPESPMPEIWTGEDNICEWSAEDQVYPEIFEQNKLQEMTHSGNSIMNEIPVKTNSQILSSSERVSDSIGEMEENTSKKLEECINNIEDWMDASFIWDSENSASDFSLNFQDKCSLRESQLMKIESGKEKLSDPPDPALLTKCTGMSTKDTAFVLLTTTHAPLVCVKDTEIKHPQSENTSHSTNENLGVLNNSLPCNNSMPEIFEQELVMKATDINTSDLEVSGEMEILSEGYKKCVSVPQNLCSHAEVSDEEADSEYQYLQERMDWDTPLANPSLATEISRTSLKEDKNECLCEEKTSMRGKATKMINVYVRPDLQITIANMLYPHHSSLKMRTGMGKFVTKCSEPKKGIKRSKKKKSEKYTSGQKNFRFYHQKKVSNTHCSSAMALPLSKRQSEKFEQSEKHITNVLHTLNTEASLCKNNGAMFHLKNAQRSVQKYLKILAKKRRNVSGSHKIIPCNLLKRSDHANYNARSVQKMAACFTERKSPTISMLTSPIEMREASEKANCKLGSHKLESSSNVTVRVIEHELSEKSTSPETMELNNTKLDSSKSRVNSEQQAYANVSENNIQKHFTPIMGSTEKALSPEASKNIAKHLNVVIRTEELSICHGDQGTDVDACESNVKKSTVRLATSVEKSSGNLKPSKPGGISKLLPIFDGKDTSSNEKEAGEMSPAQQNNISMSVDGAQAYDSSHALLPVVKSKHDTRDPQALLTPQIHVSGGKTKINNSLERNLEKICSEKQVEQQELYESKKFRLLAKPAIQPENNNERLDGHLTQTGQVVCRKEPTNKQTSPVSPEKIVRCLSASPLRGEGVISATMISPCAYDNILQRDRGLSGECSKSCKNITSGTNVPVEQPALDFIMQLSEMLWKADKTSCLNVLRELVVVCENILPLFIRALEEKQGCAFEHVLVSRENAEKSMRVKLKPCALESLVELQILMETVEFLENKRRYLQGKHTFRSLLWFDDSLCIELFGGQSGYQQQSNFYPAFQRSLKYSALSELQSHRKKLVDKFEITSLENKSYYCLLKLKREIKECEAAVKSNFPLSQFFLTEPYVCGANYGDTIEDLEKARKSTVDLINTCKSQSGIPFGAEKMEHLAIIMNIISTKIEFIRTCEEGNIRSSFIGLEHIFFNAAVSCILREGSIYVNRDLKSTEGEMLKIYEAALPKLYEIYENRVEKSERSFNGASEEHILRKSVEKPCNNKKVDGGATYDISNYLVSYPEISVGQILDEVQSVNFEKLQQHLTRCTEHLEVLKKYFQIVQEEDVDHVLITKENVLTFMESTGLRAIRLKPEAVEIYTDLAMVHETLCFLQNSVAKKDNKPRFRSLLWYDLSLVNDLFHCQQNMASFSYRKDNLLEVTESAISDLQDELSVVYDYAESLNCSYAHQLLTRELEELLETRKYLQTSVSSIGMCVDLVPYTIALNYGSSISELEYNYEQFYSLLEKLLLADRKDLGKMAHVMKILKTIEHMKFICTKQQKPPLPLVICQMLKNWRKSRQLKNQGALRRHTDANGSKSINHKRPSGVTSEDDSGDHEKSDLSDSKKKKVTSLMTTKKKQEKEARRNMRKDGRSKPLQKELQLKISTDSTWNKKDECLNDRPSLSPLYSKCLKAADAEDRIESSPGVSSPTSDNSNTLDGQKNPTDLNDLPKNWRGCSKENNQQCFASCDERGKGTSVSPNKDPSPQNSPEDSFTSAATLSGESCVLPTQDQHYGPKQDIIENASCLNPNCYTGGPLELDNSREMCGKKSVANCAPACSSNSSAIPELNKFTEMESLCSNPFSTEKIQTSAQCSAFSQNERTEETPHVHSYSVHTYKTVCPSYSWHFYQTGSSCHQVTQTYQEFSSYEMQQLTPTMLTATSMVYNAQSSMFYSQSYSYMGVGESQTYPVHSYFNSTMAFPYTYQQWPSWYTERHPTAQVAYPYSSNTGL